MNTFAIASVIHRSGWEWDGTHSHLSFQLFIVIVPSFFCWYWCCCCRSFHLLRVPARVCTMFVGWTDDVWQRHWKYIQFGAQLARRSFPHKATELHCQISHAQLGNRADFKRQRMHVPKAKHHYSFQGKRRIEILWNLCLHLPRQ